MCPESSGSRRLELTVIEAAQAFVSTTSYYRQRKESRPEFERLAFALLDLRKGADVGGSLRALTRGDRG